VKYKKIPGTFLEQSPPPGAGSRLRRAKSKAPALQLPHGNSVTCQAAKSHKAERRQKNPAKYSQLLNGYKKINTNFS
jgi:hypothetical protein